MGETKRRDERVSNGNSELEKFLCKRDIRFNKAAGTEMDVDLGTDNIIPLNIHKPAYTENRGDKYLLIWPEKPFWMVCDKEVHDLIESTTPDDTFSSLFKRFKQVFPKSSLTFHELRKFLEHLESKGLRDGGDVSDERSGTGDQLIENITVNITNTCNLNCITCYNQPMDHGKDIINSEDIDHLLSSLKGCLGKNATFAVLGGEPLLRFNETLKACKMARKHGLTPIVSTNGTVMTPDKARELKRLGVQLQISLDGATAKTNDLIRGKGSFEKVREAVKTCRKKRVHIILSMVVCQQNIHELEDFIELGMRWNVNELRFIPLKRIGKGAADTITPPSLVELINRGSKLLSENKRYRKKLVRDYFTILAFQCTVCTIRENCGTGLKTLFLDADGYLYPCPNHSYREFRFGHVRRDRGRLKELWLDSPVLNNVRDGFMVKKARPCLACHVKYWCAGGCRGESYAVYGEPGRPSPNCEESKKAIIEMMWILGKSPHLRPVKAKEEHF